jgi:hypothetical protein
MESPVGILVPLNGSINEGMLGRNLEKIKGAKTKHTHTHTHTHHIFEDYNLCIKVQTAGLV